jgi:TolB-like protein/Tfp pilus assembly protein PilF
MSPDTTPSPDKGTQDGPPESTGLGKLWRELKRRHVVRVAMVYAIVGWIVMQVAGLTFEGFGIPIWAFRFVMLMVILGFPISVVLAWAFELTPEGVKTTKTARVAHPDSHMDVSHAKKRSWLAYAVGAAVPTLIFAIFALIFYIRSDGDPELTSEDRSIAVLPFDNRSNREEDQFFTDGIHDDLLTQISRIKDIKTISRTSVMVYKGTTKNMKTIGEELGVKWLLEGGIQRGGEEIRINAQLIEASSDAHLWAEKYTRPLTVENIFEIQNEIVTLITDSLEAVISPEEKKQLEKLPTDNLAALEAYFKGKESRMKESRVGLEEAIIHFEEAISLDPDFALAQALLGQSILLHIPFSGLPIDQETAKAEPHILKALELDDKLGEAYATLGLLHEEQGDPDRAEVAYKKAIELNPNNTYAYEEYAEFLSNRVGPTPEVAALFQKAYELDPKHDLAYQRLRARFVVLGQLEEALELTKSWVTERPESPLPHRRLGNLYNSNLGRFDDAIVSFRNQLDLDPTAQNVNLGLSWCYARLGDTQKAIWWIDRYLETQQDPLLSGQMKSRKLKLAGDNEAKAQIVREALKQYPRDDELLYHLTDIELASGQTDTIRSLWEQAYPNFFEPSPEFEWSSRWIAKDVARVLIATGDREQANRLIRETVAVVNSVTPRISTLHFEAVMHAIVKDDRKALDAIRRFLNSGGSPYDLMLEDDLKCFESNPEYQTMAEKRKAELAIQLKRIREMEANGELPPIPDLPAN